MTLGAPKLLISTVFALASLCLGAEQAHARNDIVPGSRYTSARASAMGDAFIPLADDGASSLFYNPAGMGKIRGFQAEPMNLGLRMNGGFATSVGLNTYKSISLSSNLAQLQENSGSFQQMGFSLLPNVAGKGFAFGILVQNDLGATAEANGNVRYRSRYQLVPAFATGVRLAGGIVRLGYSLQWVNKAEGDITVPSGADPLGYNQNLPQGSGFSHTLGIALTFPVTLLPSFNLVARNVLGTRYGTFTILPIAKNSPGAPATDPMTLDASFSIAPKLGRGVYSNVVLQLRDATNQSGISLMGRAVAGLELSIRDLFFLRGGWGSGYPSAGFGFRRKGGEFALSWYSEEIGSSYHSVRDVRYLLQFQVRTF